ncbi:hypothetical protein CMZ82_00955 [Lysobacteraceae bacterium NML93-0792]|nr:hypothetical protein CMZ82_00955 [Xanthomonadaceae bacterium NML93-0792]PBS16633.1 hypothetical protein CMZ81_05205 [Xanthomonadaceae bacterium NML93-0793]PBS20009.1 hypothetical protein CMZ80_03260 [Xanthomonadaceae bacterium NML93-0831]
MRNPPASADAYAALGWIEEFSELARLAIDEEDDESLRRRYEDELLRRAAYLRAAGLFDVVEIRHPALRAMLADTR